MTTEELRGLPHIVILQSRTEIKTVTFTGEGADEKAHMFCYRTAAEGFQGCITVAVRVRQTCPFEFHDLMT